MTAFFERISPVSIIKNHFATLRNDRTDSYDFIEAILVIALPIAIAWAFCAVPISINDTIANSLLNLFAIMGGFLINALVLLATRKAEELRYKATLKNQQPNDPLEEQAVLERIRLLEETSHNTSFGILVCLLAVLCCVGVTATEKTQQIVIPKIDYVIHLENAFSFLIIMFLTLFMFIILMVTKRVNNIFCEN